ncbi:MAG: sensor histidine kinase [Solirubrobacteraceae bacterium]
MRAVRRPHLPRPAPTIRLRLTLTYGLVFLITGAVLLSIGYALVRHNLDARGNFRAALHRLGLAPQPGPPLFSLHGFKLNITGARLAGAVRAQLRADTLHRLLLEYVLALGAMTMVSVGAGWLLAGRALRPLREITATARRVSGENLGERIGLTGPADELNELADTFDRMLQRLDAAFASQRHFVANASHELRTPLAIMRTEVEVALADPDAKLEDLRLMGSAVLDTVDRCERLIESLLVLARSEAAAGREEDVDLSALAADCITDLEARARAAQLTLRLQLAPAWMHGDPRLLERMIANLIDNGIRHNEIGGFLTVGTAASGGKAHLLVANGGPAIDPASVHRLTEPFTRMDRAVDGFGLGLSIVHSVAQAHGGQAELRALPEGGLEVRVTLAGGPNVAGAQEVPAFTRS